MKTVGYKILWQAMSEGIVGVAEKILEHFRNGGTKRPTIVVFDL